MVIYCIGTFSNIVSNSLIFDSLRLLKKSSTLKQTRAYSYFSQNVSYNPKSVSGT